MIIDHLILLYILLALLFIVLCYSLKRIAHVRVWIKTSPKAGKPMVQMGYLQMDESGEAGEVKLSANGGKAPIARVVADSQSNKNNGYVELITSDIEDESVKPSYRKVGYIGFDTAVVDEYGIIYKQVKGKRREAIGYTARPSAPNTPTIYGERSWKTLWLVCTLNAYYGTPDPEADLLAAENKKKKKGKKDSKNEQTQTSTTEKSKTTTANAKVNSLMTINADAGKADSVEKEEEPKPTEEPLEAQSPMEEVPNTPVVEEMVVVADDTEQVSAENAVPAEDSTSEVTDASDPTDVSDSVESSDAVISEVPSDQEATETVETELESQDEEPHGSDDIEEQPAEPQEEKLPSPFDALSAEEKERLDNVKKTFPKMFSTIIDNMISVEGGTFVMGGDPKEGTIVGEDGKNRGKVQCDESPKHKVTLDSYYIGKYPVTQLEWRTVMGYNSSDCQDDTQFPVAPVSWKNAQDFLLRLSYITGTTFQLPTEAQWEFAARGGNRSKGYTFSGSDTFSEVGFSDHKHPVGQKQPNELGIYDMSGLVREWCQDIWGHYSEEDQTNPTGPAEDSPLVVRENGELYYVVRSPSGNETVCNRKGEAPDLDKEFKSYGLRIVCQSLPEKSQSSDDNENSDTSNDGAAVVPEIKQKTKNKVPAAVCHFVGFHNSKRDYLPAEARAGAYALLSQKFPKRNYSEYYKDRPYGWLDTALLSSLVFTVLFICVYIVNTGVLQMPLLGNDFFAVAILIAFYYLLWALIRLIKIDCIENSNSFQPKLDLLNKNLSMGFMNWSIIILGLLSIYFTLGYYDYDFIPLIWAILSGVGFNMMLKSANTKWIISSTFNEKDDYDEEDDTEIKNPEGDISVTYDWDLDSNYGSQKVHGNLTLFFYANEMNDLRQCNPFFAQRKDRKDEDYIMEMFNFMKEHPSFLGRVKYIVSVIDHIVEKQSMTPIDRLQFALDFVQEPNIQFLVAGEDKIIHRYDDYIRYPDETLYDKIGDSNSKSLLAAMIFHVMGYNVLYLLSRKHQHAAVGIEIKLDDLQNGWYGNAEKLQDSIIEDGGKKFLYCETTGDRFAIGSRLDDVNIDDFERKVLLPIDEENDDEEAEIPVEETITRMYNWDLDSEVGNKLHGNLTLNFEQKEIDSLRELNPFQNYGLDSNTYDANIRGIFSYLTDDASRMNRVKTVADYIRKSVEEAKLPTLDLVQFALDFTQEPNIHYEIDANSKSIDCAKEYMRFPDEVLFDKEGDCDCKSSLFTALLHCLGYNVIVMLSQKLEHAAIGVEVEEDWLTTINPENLSAVLREHNGKQYLYCETTGDGYKVGHIKEGSSIQDFETIIEIPA